ncbi:MAG: T9SS type A sorting domain-containing protein [bacterium]
MKTIFTKAIYLVLLSIVCNTITAQTFKLLSNDSVGDHNIGPDLKAISYRVDVAQDSIWFKIETYNSITSNDGFMIGLDTNQNTTDGDPWLIGSLRTVRRYDHALFIAYDLNTATVIEVSLGKVNSNNKINAGVSLVDTNELIVSTSLSLLDGDKKFDLVLGAAAADVIFTGATIDQAPEADYLTINANTTTSLGDELSKFNFKVYPNPANEALNWSVDATITDNGVLSIYDLVGNKVAEESYIKGNCDISTLKADVYIVSFKSSAFKFIKK